MMQRMLKRYLPFLLIVLLVPAAGERTINNRPPTVNAGVDQSVDAGAVVTLSGTASDPDGYIVSYQWEQTSGATVSMSDATTSTAFFTASDVTADTMLTFRLTVTDDTGAQASDNVTVMVRAVNLASLKVSVFGEGNLRIVGAGQLDCTAITICQGMFGMGSAVVIEASPDSGWTHENWNGCDETNGNQCTVFVDGARFVSVAFLSTDPPELEDDVIVLSDDQVAELIEYDIDAGLLVFGPGTPGAGQWAIGDILLSDGIDTVDNRSAPFARRIRNIVSVSNSPYYIHTIQASLDDIFRSGSLSYRAQAQEVMPSSASAPHGPVVTQSGDPEYPLQVNVYMPFGDNVTVSGTVKFSVRPMFDIDFNLLGLREARFLTHVDIESSLSVRIAAGVSVSAEKDLPLSLALPVIPLFTGIFVTPEIKTFLTINIEASASVTPTATVTIRTKAGAHYRVGRGVTPIFSATPDVDFSPGVDTPLELKAEPGIRGEVQFKINYIAGPHVGLGPYFGVRIAPVVTACTLAYAEVYGGARLAVGGEFDIFGWGARWDVPLWEQEWNFATIPLGSSQGAESLGLVTGLQIANQSLDSLTLDWPVPANNCGLVGYNVYRDDRVIAREISTTSFVDGQLTPGREYCYRVSAVGASGAETPRSGVVCGSMDSPTEGDAPESPINVAVVTLSTSAMTVMWDPPFDEGGVTGYVVYDHSGPDIYAIDSVDADTTLVDVVSLKPDSGYCFSVRSVSAAGNSDSSAVVCASTLGETKSEWTMYLGCVDQSPFTEKPIDLDQQYTSRVTVLGTGSDYSGRRLAYTLSGTYDAEVSVLNGSIYMSLEDRPDARRVDEFSVDLSSGDSGRVSMRLVEHTTRGCTVYIRLVESAVSAGSPVVASTDSADGVTISYSGVGLFEGM